MNKLKQFNCYCDESRVDNADSANMVIGCFYYPRDLKKSLSCELNELFERYDFDHELKFSKASVRYDAFYKQIIEWFLFNDSLFFRAIVVDRTKVDYGQYHQGDEELAFFKFYYFMLKPIFESNADYYIFLDKKPIRDKKHARAMHMYMNSFVVRWKYKTNIRHLQTYDSHENRFLQISDFFTGLVSKANNDSEDNYKRKLVEYIENLSRTSLVTTSHKDQKKINILKWNPYYEKDC